MYRVKKALLRKNDSTNDTKDVSHRSVGLNNKGNHGNLSPVLSDLCNNRLITPPHPPKHPQDAFCRRRLVPPAIKCAVHPTTSRDNCSVHHGGGGKENVPRLLPNLDL